MDSFKAIIGCKRMRNGENKNYPSVRSCPTRNRKFQKNSKTIQKIKKYHYGFISSHNSLENDEKQRKQKLSFCFVLTRGATENSKKIGKKFKKIKKCHYGFISSHNRLERDEKVRKYKLSFRFVPTQRVI